MLTLRGVRVEFGSTPALRGVDLKFERDRTTVLVGPSGCGKSTILRVLLGLATPSAGEATFDGAPVRRETIGAFRRRSGYVIQEGGLFPHLSARGNVTLLARHLRLAPDRIARRTDELCELTRFPEDALHRFPGELSGGQRQRVALMRALFLDPDVLLLDEPLAALDPLVRAELQDDLRAIFRARKKTVVLVTHDLSEAAFFGDRIVLLRDGAIVQSGTVRDLLDRPAEPFVSNFVRAQRRPLGGEA